MAVANIAIEVNGQQAANALKQITTASQQLESAVNNTTTKINNQNKEIQTAANGMRYFTDAAGRARAENGRFLSTAEKAAAGIKNQTAAVNGLRGAVSELLGAFALASTAKFIFAKTAELESQTKSLEVLTGSVTKAKAIIQELQQLGAVTPFTSTELIDSAKRLNAFGVEGDKVVETTRRLADVAGATGAELQGLVTAYGQVQAKGRLQGEELLQFQERGIALQAELRKMYGLSGEEFQKALSKGRISAEAVEVAIKRLTDAGGKYANGAIAQSDTLQGKFSTLTDSVEELARTVGTVFAPLFKWLITEATNVISVITDAINMAAQGPQKAKVIAQIRAGKIPTASLNPIDYLTGNTANNKLLDVLGKGNLAAGDKILKDLARQSSKGPGYLPDPNKLIKLLQQQPTIKAPTAATATATGTTVPPLLAETGGGKTGSGAANKAANDAARLAEQTKQQLDAAYKLNALAAADLDIQVSMTKEETLQGQFDKAALERKFKYADLQKSVKSEQERQLIISAQENEVLIANNKYAKDKKDLLEQQTKELYSQLDVSGVLDKTLQNRLSGAFMGGAATGGFRTDVDLDPNKKAGKIQEYVDKAKTDLADVQGMIVSLATTVEGSIGTAMSSAISGVIAGTATVKDAFASMFKSIGDAFIQMATQMIAKALIMKVLGILGGAFGGGIGATNYSSAFSGGGAAFNPSAFTGGMNFFADGGFVNRPTNAMIGEGGQPEYVIPASKMRESMSRYAAGARGSAVLGSGNGTSDSGGGAATMNGSSIDVRYTVERINSVDYVTASQFQQGMQKAAMEGAQRGQQATLRRLQNSSSTRRAVGI